MLTKIQRVAVAKDVIKQVKAGRYIAMRGSEIHEHFYPKDNADLQQFAKSIKRCSVCAKGALFISDVKKYNNYEAKGRFGRELDSKLIADWGHDTMDMVEVAFERTAFGWNHENLDDDVIDKCKVFGKKYKTDNTRLKKIMENIIKNKGTFIP